MNRSIHPIPFVLAILVGSFVNYVGDWVLDVRVELFWGLETFNFRWFLAIFILPVLVGMAVAYIYGLGGKWVALFPPLLVHLWSYYETKHLLGVPEGADLMPMGWWGFFVILVMEVSMIGGMVGEIAIKRIYGRSDPSKKGAIDVSDHCPEIEILPGQEPSAENRSKDV